MHDQRSNPLLSGFLALAPPRLRMQAPVVLANHAAADGLRRHAQGTTSTSTHEWRGWCGGEQAAKRKRLFQIPGQARRAIAAVAVVDAILAWQRGQHDAERAQ